jgi:protein-disulfide isomerase
MHAALFRNQKALSRGDLQLYAVDIGLDAEAFEADLSGGAHLERIQADFDGGRRSGVGGTPTFFTNGHRHDGPYTGSVLLAALRSTALGT